MQQVWRAAVQDALPVWAKRERQRQVGWAGCGRADTQTSPKGQAGQEGEPSAPEPRACPSGRAIGAAIGQARESRAGGVVGAIWHTAAFLGELAEASSVLIATYMYDDPSVHETLLKKLRGRGAFQCDVCVDKAAFDQKSCYRQQPRLEAHRDAGAMF